MEISVKGMIVITGKLVSTYNEKKNVRTLENTEVSKSQTIFCISFHLKNVTYSQKIRNNFVNFVHDKVSANKKRV